MRRSILVFTLFFTLNIFFKIKGLAQDAVEVYDDALTVTSSESIKPTQLANFYLDATQHSLLDRSVFQVSNAQRALERKKQLGARCDKVQQNGRTAINGAISPKQLLETVRHINPDVVLLGESHMADDYKVWGHDTFNEYRKMNPDVNCIFSEQHSDSDYLSTFLRINEVYAENNDMQRSVEIVATELGQKFESFKTQGQTDDDNFSMRIGDLSTIENRRPKQIFFNSADIRRAVKDGIYRIPVDNRKDNVDRDIFMAKYISFIMKSGLCKKAIFRVGKGHNHFLKYFLGQEGVSAYSIGLWSQNPLKVKNTGPTRELLPYYTDNGFLSLPKTCSSMNLSVPTKPIAIVSDPKSGTLVGDPGFFKFTLNQFDAHIVAPVVLVKDHKKMFEEATRIYE